MTTSRPNRIGDVIAGYIAVLVLGLMVIDPGLMLDRLMALELRVWNGCKPTRIVIKMSRIFSSADFLQPIDGEPIRSVITESKESVVVAWYVKPGQKIAAHMHPHGQDTWTILTGKGDYYLDQVGTTQPIQAGDVVVAPIDTVHGVCNNGDEPLVFISVVSPADAGYQLAERQRFAAK